MRRNVANCYSSKWPPHFMATLAKPIGEVVSAVGTAGMTFHAMGDGRQIKSARDRIVQRRLVKRLLSAGNEFDVHRSLVDRRLDLIADRPNRTNIGDHRIKIARGQNLIEGKRHLRRKRYAVEGRMVWANAFRQSTLQFVCVPGTDPGGGVGRDIRALHQEARLVPSL